MTHIISNYFSKAIRDLNAYPSTQQFMYLLSVHITVSILIRNIRRIGWSVAEVLEQLFDRGGRYTKRFFV